MISLEPNGARAPAADGWLDQAEPVRRSTQLSFYPSSLGFSGMNETLSFRQTTFVAKYLTTLFNVKLVHNIIIITKKLL